MSDEPQTSPANAVSNTGATPPPATTPAEPTSSLTADDPHRQQAQPHSHPQTAPEATADSSQGEPSQAALPHPKRRRQGALHREPLLAHPLETKLAAMRAALAAGADPNGLDNSEPWHYREGRPLDACLHISRMAGGVSVMDNLPLIELLLEHGADPRLSDFESNTLVPAAGVAKYYAEKPWSPAAKVFFDRLVVLFEEAIVRLKEKKKEEEAKKDKEGTAEEED